MRLRAYLAAVFLLALFPLAAGEIASFVNLGFSQDSQSFMFGIYGINEKNTTPWAEAFIVNTVHNTFTENGVGSFVSSRTASLGQDGSSALFTLLHDMNSSVDTYRIDHTNTGRLVYILLNGVSGQDEISFRDFNTGNTYSITVKQQKRTFQENAVEASFSLSIKATDSSGKTKTMTVGKPNYFRKDVEQYLVRQVILSPDEKSLVFVIEKRAIQKGSFSTSYMVETIKVF